MLSRVIRFYLENKLVVAVIVLAVIGWGVLAAPGCRRTAALSGPDRRDSRHRRESTDRLHGMDGPLAARRGGPDHVSADRLAAVLVLRLFHDLDHL